MLLLVCWREWRLSAVTNCSHSLQQTSWELGGQWVPRHYDIKCQGVCLAASCPLYMEIYVYLFVQMYLFETKKEGVGSDVSWKLLCGAEAWWGDIKYFPRPQLLSPHPSLSSANSVWFLFSGVARQSSSQALTSPPAQFQLALTGFWSCDHPEIITIVNRVHPSFSDLIFLRHPLELAPPGPQRPEETQEERKWRQMFVTTNILSTISSSHEFCYLVPTSKVSMFNDAMLCYAKSLQSCPTLCDPIDGSPPGQILPPMVEKGWEPSSPWFQSHSPSILPTHHSILHTTQAWKSKVSCHLSFSLIPRANCQQIMLPFPPPSPYIWALLHLPLLCQPTAPALGSPQPLSPK